MCRILFLQAQCFYPRSRVGSDKDLGAAVTSTTEGGAVIPQTIVDRIIEKLQASGMILPRVTQTAYKGGVSIPVSLVKPVGEWVAEGSDATGKKLDAKTTGNFPHACGGEPTQTGAACTYCKFSPRMWG